MDAIYGSAGAPAQATFDRESEAVDAREFGFRKNDVGWQDNGNLSVAFAQLPAKSILRFPAGAHLIVSGAETKKPIMVEGQWLGTDIRWVPTSAGSTLFKWTNLNSTYGDLNEEGNLWRVGIRNVTILGDRKSRANALHFDRCDHGLIENVYVRGVRGFSLKADNSREFWWRGFRTRYNGHCDTAVPANSVGDVIMASPNAGVDTTNFWNGSDIWLAYSFWDEWWLDNADNNVFAPWSVHSIPEADSQFEANLVALFGGYRGFRGGVAGNEYASLHVPVTGDEATVSGLSLAPAFRARVAIGGRKSQNNRWGVGQVRGGRQNALVWADEASEFYFSNVDIQASNSSTSVSGTATFDSGTEVVTVSGVAFPQTGEPVRFTTTGTLPAEVVAGTTYYAIRIDATTGRLATSAAGAEAGTSINLSGAGSGVHTLHSIQGFAVRATGAAKVFLDPTTTLNDGRQATYHDGTPGHNIIGVPRLGGTWSDINGQSQPFVVGPALGSGPGVLIQDLATRKLGVHGSAPTTQRASASQAAIAASGATSAEIATLLNEIRAALVEKGLIKGSA